MVMSIIGKWTKGEKMDIETELLFCDGGLSKIRFLSKMVSALLSAAAHLDEIDDIFGEYVLLELSKANLTPDESSYLTKIFLSHPGFLSRPGHVGIEMIEIPRPSRSDDMDDAVWAIQLIPCPHRPEYWAGGAACSRCDYFRGAATLENGNTVVRCAFLNSQGKNENNNNNL